MSEAASNIRTYKVLRRETIADPVDGLAERVVLDEIGEYDAGDHRGAIRQAVREHGFAQYVAVAESSWHEEAPAPDPEPRIRWAATA